MAGTRVEITTDDMIFSVGMLHLQYNKMGKEVDRLEIENIELKKRLDEFMGDQSDDLDIPKSEVTN